MVDKSRSQLPCWSACLAEKKPEMATLATSTHYTATQLLSVVILIGSHCILGGGEEMTVVVADRPSGGRAGAPQVTTATRPSVRRRLS